MSLLDIPICFTVALLVASYQIYRCLRYLRDSIRISHNYDSKVEQGCMKAWEYLFILIPLRYRDYYSYPGVQGGNFYLTPLVVFLALFGNPLGWIAVLLCLGLGLGRGLFKLASPLCLRLPFYWVYFAGLVIVMLAVEGLGSFSLNTVQLTLLCVVVAVLLFHNSFCLPVFPEGYLAKRPSHYFDTPLLRYLEKNATGRVNNMQYPYYHGQINHIRSMGYCGGNYKKWLKEFRNLPLNGCGGYNWFDYKADGVDLDIYEVQYHIGERPSQACKWFKVKGFKNLWRNTNVGAE